MKRIFLILSSLLVVFLGIGLFIKFNTSSKDQKIFLSNHNNTEGAKFLNNLNASIPKEENLKPLTAIPYEVNLYLKKSKLTFKNELLHKSNRYYVPLNEFSSYLGKDVVLDGNKIKVSDNSTIDISNRNYEKDGQIVSLRGDIQKINEEYYISFFDICDILDLKTYWDYQKNTIYINNKKDKKEKKEKKEKKNKKKAYIRFEDFTAGDVYNKQETLDKIRIVADYMKDESENFSLSWVPKYISYTNNKDNDISKDMSMINANFVFTLDYLVNKGAIVGLHGYTHQYGSNDSVISSEFGKDGYSDPKEIRNRVQAALTIASKLNIPCDYWETPHYIATPEQQAIFEEYFNIIYEPFIGVYNKKIITSERNGVTKFIPAPLSYVKDRDAASMIKSMEENTSDTEMSLFYHPSKEIDSIHLSVDTNGIINSTYDDNSILKQLVISANKLGYTFSSIKE
ncbi:polysaccharide deacetylase family protein [Clostridium carnis]